MQTEREREGKREGDKIERGGRKKQIIHQKTKTHSANHKKDTIQKMNIAKTQVITLT